ncbi:MAG: T9SS type A sorting domain-containing protein [Saprospiraceae bacterium]|nr:T9SS type A sorting domain-containing protein [Saprospiraceae bacterium]
MKPIFTFLVLCFLYSIGSSQNNCSTKCPIPFLNWESKQCEHYENLSLSDPLITNDWEVYPASPNYRPKAAGINYGTFGTQSLAFADFYYGGTPVDNNYHLRIDPQSYRFSYDMLFEQGWKGQLSMLDANYNLVLTFEFLGSGTANIRNANDAIIGKFSYPLKSWFNMNLYYHQSGSIEIFRNNYKVFNATNIPNTKSTFPSIANFYANRTNDAFLLGGVCLTTSKFILITCSLDYNPVCLNGTNEEVGTNGCWAGQAGYLGTEYHPCRNALDPCADCDDCFSYLFDCVDPRIIHLTSSYCEEVTPTNGPEGTAVLEEFEWEFKNENNVIIQPEYLNGTSSLSINPSCKIPISGTYLICFKVFRFTGSGRIKIYECCYFVKIGKPCTSSPTVYINSTNPNSNSEVSFTQVSTDAETFSWRVDDQNAYINNVSTTASTFKCKIPTGKECINVCLTIGNGCGMIYKCVKICRPNPNCGTKPSPHPPILYQLNQNAEVSFLNVPQMDTYEWTLSEGCTFTGGTTSNSKNPICKLPDPSCSYMICLRMFSGSCYQCCYCFTIKPQPVSVISFDPDEMACVAAGQEVLVPVRVKGFTNVTSLDLTFVLNPTTVADFIDVVGGPNINSSTLVKLLTGTSKMKVAWAGTSGSGTTLNDNDIFCYLKIKMKGAANSMATISIDGTNHIVKQNRVTVIPTLKTGSVCVNGSYTICGKITREDNLGIKDANVELTGSVNQTVKTDASGNYCFTNVPAGSFTIRPRKNINFGNGVEIADISDIQGHLLGTFTLPSPYKMIAADADNNRSITATDIARIIPVFLNKSQPFAAVESWRFIPKSFVFPNANNPFQATFPESISLQVSKNESNQDFTGIKMGDVDLDNDPQKIVGGDREIIKGNQMVSRAAPVIDIKLDSIGVKPGESGFIKVTAKGFTKVISFGFSVSWQEAKIKFNQLLNLNPKLNLSSGHFNIKEVEKGKLGVTWFILNNEGITLNDNEVLFTIEYTAIGQDKEESKISFTSSPTPISFADGQSNFTVNSKNGAITIDKNIVASKDFNATIKYQLWPSPAEKELFISFETAIQENLKLELFSTDGKVIPANYERRSEALIKLDVEHLTKGLYYLRIKTDKGLTAIPFTRM